MSEDDQINCGLENVLLDEGCDVEASCTESVDNPVLEIESSDVDKQEADCLLCEPLLEQLDEVCASETPCTDSVEGGELSKQLDEISSVEGKIRFCLEAMRQTLSREGSPRFRDFWNIRQLCLTFFKESISPKLRSQLWGLYIELSSESKRLKEILDEQSAFASEQIELAIQALERDVAHQDILLAQVPEESFSLDNLAMKERLDTYYTLQRQINLFNGLASRVNALRKEVLKTEMRIRIKNKFLSRLSVCGDLVFPKRKELIQQISSLFMEDVDQFVKIHFQDEEFRGLPLYALREEVKQLQSVAKILTLGSHVFTEARLKLSQCWDKMKDKEKERRLQTQQKRQAFKQNFDLVMEKIVPFKEACKEGISEEECQKQSSELLQFMRTVELGREEVMTLKEEIFQAKRAPLERAKQEDLERQKKEAEKETNRRTSLIQLKEAIETLLLQAAEMDGVALSVRMQEFIASSEQITLLKAEKQVLERLFKQVKDLVHEKKTQALLLLPEEDQQVLEQLKSALEEHKQRRQEMKKQLEGYRKLLGGSGLDFEKAMLYRETIELEKAALEKVESAIGDIEQKIDEIEM